MSDDIFQIIQLLSRLNIKANIKLRPTQIEHTSVVRVLVSLLSVNMADRIRN